MVAADRYDIQNERKGHHMKYLRQHIVFKGMSDAHAEAVKNGLVPGADINSYASGDTADIYVSVMLVETKNREYLENGESESAYEWVVNGVAFGKEQMKLMLTDVAAEINTEKLRYNPVDTALRTPNYAAPFLKAWKLLARDIEYPSVLRDIHGFAAELPAYSGEHKKEFIEAIDALLADNLPESKAATLPDLTYSLSESVAPFRIAAAPDEPEMEERAENIINMLRRSRNDLFVSSRFVNAIKDNRASFLELRALDNAIMGIENELPHLFSSDARIQNRMDAVSTDAAFLYLKKLVHKAVESQEGNRSSLPAKSGTSAEDLRVARYIMHMAKPLLKSREAKALLRSTFPAGTFLKRIGDNFEEYCAEAIKKTETQSLSSQKVEYERLDKPETIEAVIKDMRAIERLTSAVGDEKGKEAIDGISEIAMTAKRLGAKIDIGASAAMDIKRAAERIAHKKEVLEARAEKLAAELKRRQSAKTKRYHPTPDELQNYEERIDNAVRLSEILEAAIRSIDELEQHLLYNDEAIAFQDTIEVPKKYTPEVVAGMLESVDGVEESLSPSVWNPADEKQLEDEIRSIEEQEYDTKIAP